jgi:hypothetical protein
MGQFLTQSGSVARLGLSIFPSDSTCGATNAIRKDIPQTTQPGAAEDATLQQAADAINTDIGTITPGGGTPIGNSLNWVRSNVPRLKDELRQNFVLLLTDGAPNCNAQHPATTLAACRCVLVSCGSEPNITKIGCLDDEGSTRAVQALKDQNIRTIVVGFGADAAGGDAFNALNDMASAGGFARQCPNGTDAECGSGNVCLSTGECQKKYYAATNATELATALATIASGLDPDPCGFRLDTVPSDNEFISVLLNGERVEPGPTTWEYDPANQRIQFIESGSICPQLKEATPATPQYLEFRVVQAI